MSISINSGPMNKELLYLEKDHRAYYLFTGQEDDVDPDKVLTVRRGDSKFWDYIKSVGIPDSVMEYITRAGFGGVVNVGCRQIDLALVTAFVERWRPETHTFHLPCGEATITLEDVQILLGLRIDGDVITCYDPTTNVSTIRHNCERLLGFVPETSDLSGGKIKSSVILHLQHIKKPLPTNSTVEQLMQRARLYIFHILGSTLFADSTSNLIPLIYLGHLVDLDYCGRLCWGTSILGCLYSKLCRATHQTIQEISGPLLLLQLWAWTRVPCLRPELKIEENINKPYGAWFRRRISYRGTGTVGHVLKAIRSQLTMISEDEFIWTPYKLIRSKLPEICTSGQRYWRCRIPLIFWDVVEFYDPARVMRQFGMFQTIPLAPMFSPHELKTLHGYTHQGKPNTNWSEKHKHYIALYSDREKFVANGVETDSFTASREYMDWYLQRTIIHITNPIRSQVDAQGFRDDGGRLHTAFGGFSQIQRDASIGIEED